jgi:hypothetical protein
MPQDYDRFDRVPVSGKVVGDPIDRSKNDQHDEPNHCFLSFRKTRTAPSHPKIATQSREQNKEIPKLHRTLPHAPEKAPRVARDELPGLGKFASVNGTA